MANADVKILEAEKLHHPIINRANTVPGIPLGENKNHKRNMTEYAYY